MMNTIRCCISCILPCGGLDMIRIVHANGRVEEIGGTVKAAEIMKANPKHVLKKPSSSLEEGIMCPKIVIVPPDAELQRGKIYFLIPVHSSSSTTSGKKTNTLSKSSSSSSSSWRKKKKKKKSSESTQGNANNNIRVKDLLISDQYLSEILSENISTQRDRRRGRVGIWRPRLESISEASSES